MDELTEYKHAHDYWKSEADRLRAELAAAREMIAKSVQLYESYGLLAQHKDCGQWINESSAFLERTAQEKRAAP